jgi:hypothetical protein
MGRDKNDGGGAAQLLRKRQIGSRADPTPSDALQRDRKWTLQRLPGLITLAIFSNEQRDFRYRRTAAD